MFSYAFKQHNPLNFLQSTLSMISVSHNGMAHLQVVDGGMASNLEGSCK